MTTVTYSNSALQIDQLTWSGATAVPLLGMHAFSVPSDPLDNTPSNTQALSYRYAMLRLAFNTPQPVNTNPPLRLVLTLLPILDGTNISSPPGTSAIAPPANHKMIELLIPSSKKSQKYQIVDFGDPGEGFKLGPFKYAFQLYNDGQYPWTGAIIATLYRWNLIHN